MNRITGVVVLLIALGGCKDDNTEYQKKREAELQQQAAAQQQQLDQLVAKHKDKVAKIIAAVRAGIAEANKAPPVTAREPIADGVALAADGMIVVTPDIPTKLADPAWGEDVERELAPSHVSTDMPPDLKRIEDDFTRVDRASWLVVARVHDYSAPKAADKTFSGAGAAGDAIVYTLPERKRVGGFTWELAQQTDEITVVGDHDAVKQLEGEFRRQLFSALSGEAAAYSAGKTGPANAGASALATQARLENRVMEATNKWLVANTVLAPVSKVSIASGDGPMIVTIYTFDPAEAKAHEAGIAKLVQSTLGTPVTLKFVPDEK